MEENYIPKSYNLALDSKHLNQRMDFSPISPIISKSSLNAPGVTGVDHNIITTGGKNYTRLPPLPQLNHDSHPSQQILPSAVHPPTPPEEPQTVYSTPTMDLSVFRELLESLWKKGLELQPRINGIWRAGINDWRVCNAENNAVLLEETGPSKQVIDEQLKKRERMSGWGETQMEKEDKASIASRYKKMRLMVHAQTAAATSQEQAQIQQQMTRPILPSTITQPIHPIPIAPNPVIPIKPSRIAASHRPTINTTINTSSNTTKTPAISTQLTEDILDDFFPSTVSRKASVESTLNNTHMLTIADQQAIEALFDL